jgi:glycosyltransferase involved in cell wall biosynthesis
VPSKNPLLALSIIEKILASGRQARLLIFGGGALRAECEVIAESINRAHGDGAVVFGAPELYFDALSEASLFLSLQDHDNYPSQSLMEAMAYGCRCVCTSDGDTRLMFPVGSDDHALLDSRDPKEFADACLRFIDRREPSTVNSEHIFSNHSISAFSRYFDEFMGLAVASRREAKPSY